MVLKVSHECCMHAREPFKAHEEVLRGYEDRFPTLCGSLWDGFYPVGRIVTQVGAFALESHVFPSVFILSVGAAVGVAQGILHFPVYSVYHTFSGCLNGSQDWCGRITGGLMYLFLLIIFSWFIPMVYFAAKRESIPDVEIFKHAAVGVLHQGGMSASYLVACKVSKLVGNPRNQRVLDNSTNENCYGSTN